MVKVLGLQNDKSGCDYHRVILPFQYGCDYIDNTGFVGKETIEDLLQAADAVTWNRIFPFGGISINQVKKQYGCKVIIDLDDYWHLYPKHYMAAHYQRNSIPAKTVEAIRLADTVTVTTARLADKVKEYNRNVHVIPNALPFGHGQFAPGEKIGSSRYRFLYPCQLSHLYDAGILKGPLQRVASENRKDIGFTLAGYKTFDKSGIWAKIDHIFARSPNYTRIEQLPLDEYMRIYDHVDAVLVPLENNTFNHHKSNLKLLEAATRKLPVICQKVPPYSDSDAPVLWVERQSDWYKHIRYLAGNPNAGIEMGERLYEWALTRHNLFDHNRYRFELYGHIVNS
ncbi:hypothetical protein AB6805_30585 [Chitinophaga sp. RCC_12]|uniref:glycosyltransferase family protein n=1 Tax=Chitinophaga sp. RCC_12 TaxID=3239226 RepID=UPI003523FCF2